MPGRGWRIVVPWAAVLALVGGACREQRRPQEGRPTEEPTGIVTDIPTELPTGAGTFTAGRANIELTGDVEERLDLQLSDQIPTTYVFGVITANWGGPGGDLVSINGTADVGRNLTGAALNVIITLENGVTYSSFGPECTVRLERADEDGLDGSLDCEGISSTSGSVDASGNFSASA